MYKNLAATLAVAACFFSPFTSHAQGSPDPLKIGFVYVAPLTDAGWVRQHEEGRKAVQSALGLGAPAAYRLARNSFEASFADSDAKAGWIDRLDDTFARFA